MRAIKKNPVVLTDSERERQIELCRQEMYDAPDHLSMLSAWGKMKNLINGRSATQILHMEQKRGLR